MGHARQTGQARGVIRGGKWRQRCALQTRGQIRRARQARVTVQRRRPGTPELTAVTRLRMHHRAVRAARWQGRYRQA